MRESGNGPLLRIFGGDITTHRKLAEPALRHLKPFLPQMVDDWTTRVPLGGGGIGSYGKEAYEQWLQAQANNYPWLAKTLLERLGRAYGSQLHEVLAGATAMADMGRFFGADLYQIEVEYLLAKEWACSGEDILWRRSKLGLYFTPAQVDKLEAFVGALNQNSARH